jgi:hypothetical protein
MWRERAIRFLLVGGAVLVILGGVRYLVTGKERPVSAPKLPISEEQIKPLREEVLGTVGRVFSGERGDKEKEKEKETNQEKPSLAPVQNVQEQTQDLIESIKSLPEDQIKVIKKQIYQEFCEGLIEK